MVSIEELREESRKLIKKGTVKYIIGYKKGSDGLKTVPAFIRNEGDVDQLVWDPTCVYNLVRFLVAEKRKTAKQKEPDRRPVGLIVKGCDSRAVNVLLQEKFITREDVYIIGLSCGKSGVADQQKLLECCAGALPESVEFSGEASFLVTTASGTSEIPAVEVLAQRCLDCRYSSPLIHDLLLGEPSKRNPENPFTAVEELEAKDVEERWTFWKENMDRCLRCYACRSVCPMCYCEECVVDSITFSIKADTSADEKAKKIRWIERSLGTSENSFYHMVRAMHLAGRCVDCGECERVCPVDIPIRLLNQKLEKDAKLTYQYVAGLDANIPALVSSFRDEDPEDFIR